MLLLIPGATALDPLNVSFDQTSLEGTHQIVGPLLGASISSPGIVENGWMRGSGRMTSVTTTNYTLLGAGGLIGREYDSGGDTFHYANFSLEAGTSAPGPDLAIFRTPDTETNVSLDGFETDLTLSSVTVLQETARVNNARPVYEERVQGALQATMSSPESIRLVGSFVISIWAWNFTIADTNSGQTFVTGAYRQPPQPGMPSNAIYTEFAQVAQVKITEGSLEIGGLKGAQVVAFANSLKAQGYGMVIAKAATTLPDDSSGLQFGDSTVEAEGRFELSAEGDKAVANLEILRLDGKLKVDGRAISLGRQGPLQPSTNVADRGPFSSWAWPLGFVALMVVGLLVKGPAMTGRFNRIQMRFDQHDYVGVLDRIESFTHRSKYARRASFLKAVSLLSLNEFKEASLYLQTLAPHEAPEPATKAFLQACAAAGLGQDSTAINHLSECLKDDPSYIEEAKTVPALVGYLPYFSISPGEAAT